MSFMKNGIGNRPLKKEKKTTLENTTIGIVKRPQEETRPDNSKSLEIVKHLQGRHIKVDPEALAQWSGGVTAGNGGMKHE